MEIIAIALRSQRRIIFDLEIAWLFKVMIVGDKVRALLGGGELTRETEKNENRKAAKFAHAQLQLSCSKLMFIVGCSSTASQRR
jgi:hypothetical protein